MIFLPTPSLNLIHGIINRRLNVHSANHCLLCLHTLFLPSGEFIQNLDSPVKSTVLHYVTVHFKCSREKFNLDTQWRVSSLGPYADLQDFNPALCNLWQTVHTQVCSAYFRVCVFTAIKSRFRSVLTMINRSSTAVIFSFLPIPSLHVYLPISLKRFRTLWMVD